MGRKLGTSLEGVLMIICLVIKNVIVETAQQPFAVVGCVKADDGTIVIGEETQPTLGGRCRKSGLLLAGFLIRLLVISAIPTS